MAASKKLFYEAPSVLVIEVRSEGLICNSGDPQDPQYTGFGREVTM